MHAGWMLKSGLSSSSQIPLETAELGHMRGAVSACSARGMCSGWGAGSACSSQVHVTGAGAALSLQVFYM